MFLIIKIDNKEDSRLINFSDKIFANDQLEVHAIQLKILFKGTFTSDGATCPETLSTSDLVQVKEDQCVTENCDIRYTSCFDVAQTKFLNCISIKKEISVKPSKTYLFKAYAMPEIAQDLHPRNRLHIFGVI